jgi:hypothetical protein
MASPRVLKETEQLCLEKAKATELVAALLLEHLPHAASCRVEEKFAVSIAITFERNAHNTELKAKISYSKKYSEVIEAIASPFQQLNIESAIQDEVDKMFGPKPS